MAYFEAKTDRVTVASSLSGIKIDRRGII
jgi:hypothetical protein